MTVELKVPSVGESVTEVVLGEWLKAEGDHVEQDELVIELESEKATFDAPAPAAGVLTKILKQAGETAHVGEVIAQIEPGAGGGSEAAERKSKPARHPPQEHKTEPPKKEQDETKEQKEPREEPAKPHPQPKREPVKSETTTEPRLMPAARSALEEHGLHAEDVAATGPGGRLLKEDVLRHVEQTQTAEREEPKKPTPSSAAKDARGEETVPMSPIRRRIAERLVRAQQTAALLTTFNEIDMTTVKELRRQQQDAFQAKHGVKLGFMSFFVKAAVVALQEIPQVNAEIRDDQIVHHHYCDIGIAIGGGKGLVVPVLRDAENMTFAQIEKAIEDFAQRAQKGELQPDELRGGTFTITNGGIYGSLLSTPIVNPPQSGVLGMHAIQDRPVVRDGAIVARPMMYVALTYDHRLVDGREAVTFLRRIKELVEEPSRLLFLA